MSGFTNITGFAPPTSVAGFMGLLQTASFRGVPFKVVAAQVKKGRRQAIHEYPFVDGGWAEDMGRALRTYAFSGYLIGDAAPVMQLLLDNAVETEGAGLLIHPTIGAVQVAVLSAGTAVHRDKMRVIEVAFEFVEQGGSVFPMAIIATAVAVLAAADAAVTAAGTDLGGVAIPAAAIGPAVTGEGQAVVNSFAGAVTLGGADPTAIVGMAAALPSPDSSTTYGRYGAGSASVSLPIGTTVGSLQAQLANQRAALALAASGATSAAGGYSASTDMLGALATLVEAMRAGITDPANQVRVLLGLAGFTFSDNAGGSVGTGAAMAAMRDAMAAACRRAALVSLARASASYQPVSYNDAAALRLSLAAALDTEITAAGDSGEDATYSSLKALRSAVVQDLTVRGASLPSVVMVNLQLPLPSLAIAQFLYRDASRSDEIAAEACAVHPAFCPVTFQALTSGLGQVVAGQGTNGSALSSPAGVLIRPASTAGVYHLPLPAAPLALSVVSSTSSGVVLAWSAAATGGLAANYVVQVSPSGVGAWTTAGTVTAAVTSYGMTGLSSSTAYDFQVYATNASGSGSPSALVTASTLMNPPNAATSIMAAAGSPAYSAAAVSWTAPAADSTHGAATGYHVYQALHPMVAWTYVADTSVTNYTFTGLAHATGYDFLIVPFNTGGASPANNSYSDWVTGYAPPNAPAIGSVTPVNDGTVTKLAVTWSAPATDGTHDAATGYNLRYSVHAANAWTVVSGVSSGAVIMGLSAATSYDVQVQGTNASSASPGAWAGSATANTYSTTVAWGVSGAPQTSGYTHGSGNINGVSNAGTNANTSPNPTTVYFVTSTSNTTIPTTGLTSISYYGTTYDWAAYMPVPATAGTYYLWALAENSSVVAGALVSAAITVT